MQWRWCVWLQYWWTVLWLACLDRCIACFPRCQQHKQFCLLLLWRWDMLHLLHWMIPLAGKLNTSLSEVWGWHKILKEEGLFILKSSPPCTSFPYILLYQYYVPTVTCTCLCFTDPLIMCFLQHIMLSLRFMITCAIPDLPSWVATEMAKVEFARREACRRLSSTAASPTPDVTIPPPGLVIGRLVILCQYITFQQLVTNIGGMVRVIGCQNIPHEAGKIAVTNLMSSCLCALWSPKDIVTETALFRRWKNKFILETIWLYHICFYIEELTQLSFMLGRMASVFHCHFQIFITCWVSLNFS